MNLRYKLSPTLDSFVFSKHIVNVLIGPQGEGKTWGAAVAMANYAQEFHEYQKNKWAGNTDMIVPMRGVLIRDSLENIKRHTIPSIQKALPGFIQIVDDSKKMVGSNFVITNMGLGEGGDIAKLQYGAEYIFGWLEEPAPMVAQGSAGLKRDVFDATLARCSRMSEFRPRIQVTMNPPEEEHWTYEEFYQNPRFPNPDAPNVTMAVWHLPYGDNKTLTPLQREMNKVAWSRNKAMYTRFVEGKPALTVLGQSITPEYQEKDDNGNPWHRTARDKQLNPVPGTLTYRFWDGGHNPSCVFAQWHPVTGQLCGLDTLRGDNIGMFQFVEQYVKPLMAKRYYKITMWRDIGDDSIASRDQSNTDFSAARIIENKLKATFEKGEKNFKPRRESLKQLLMDTVMTPDGIKPKFLLSWHEQLLHRGLSGGYHFHEDASGKINDREPVKNLHSHPCDALSYGVEKVCGTKYGSVNYLEIEKKERAFIESYA